MRSVEKPYVDLSKRRVLINAFFLSQFSYCSLVWMCYSRIKNNKINCLHERCLRLIYNAKLKYTNFMIYWKGMVLSQHINETFVKGIRFLKIEIFKIMKGTTPVLEKCFP